MAINAINQAFWEAIYYIHFLYVSGSLRSFCKQKQRFKSFFKILFCMIVCVCASKEAPLSFWQGRSPPIKTSRRQLTHVACGVENSWNYWEICAEVSIFVIANKYTQIIKMHFCLLIKSIRRSSCETKRWCCWQEQGIAAKQLLIVSYHNAVKLFCARV